MALSNKVLTELMPLKEREELPRTSLGLHHTFGFDALKRNNVHVLNETNFVTSVGNTAVFYTVNPEDGSITNTRFIYGQDLGGIGCICVHPSKKFVAIGCCLPEIPNATSRQDGAEENSESARAKLSPNIYVYEFPSLSLYKTLRDGTEQGYSCMSFSANGDKLASVGKFPDFLLTTWNWEEERIILRCKAFAQEVYNVSFSPINDGFLVTSGMGHIRFWKMARTFTGLKLQGDIGKFGKVDLSDVSAYAEMPDGKVLSGSECGSLLLWDGNFIKLEVRMPGDKLPHQGEVQVCMLIRNSSADGVDDPSKFEFLTAGNDGYFRWWCFSDIDNAELGDEETCLTLSPLREVYFPNIVPRSFVIGDGFALLQDLKGAIHRLAFPFTNTESLVKLLHGHSGPILGMDVSSHNHLVATTGSDHSVRLLDFGGKVELSMSVYPSAGTSLAWFPESHAVDIPTVVAGFQNGVIRILASDGAEWKLVQALKPFTKSVTTLKFSRDGKKLATCGEDGTVFLFSVSNKTTPSETSIPQLDPIGFVSTHDSCVARTICWNHDSQRFVVGLSEGRVEEFSLSDEVLEQLDTSTTFELELNRRLFTFERRDLVAEKRKEEAMKAAMAGDSTADGDESTHESNKTLSSTASKKEQSDDEEEVIIIPVGNVTTLEYSQPPGSSCESLFVCLDGADSGVIHKCEWDSQFPIAEYPSGSIGVPLFELGYSSSGSVLSSSCSNGVVEVRSISHPNVYARVLVHSAAAGGGNKSIVSHDNKFVVSAGNDGGLFVLSLNDEEFHNHAALLAEAVDTHKPRPSKLTERDETSEKLLFDLSTQEGRNVIVVDKELQPTTLSERNIELSPRDDITGDEVYSIQDAKLKAEEDNRRKLAEAKKDSIRHEVKQLQEQFESLLKENDADIPEQQVSEEDLAIDPELDEILEKEGDALVDEVILTMQFETRKLDIQVEKLHKYYFDRVEVDSIQLGAFNSSECVSSFRTLKFPENVTRSIQRVTQAEQQSQQTLESEQTKHLGSSPGGIREASTTLPNADAMGATSTDGDSENPVTQALQNAGGMNRAENTEHHGWESRKLGRKQRKKDMEQLLESKPNENDDDPQDTLAIRWATENMGDYKLKTASNYKVPHGVEVTAKSRRKACLLLAQAIQDMRSQFNSKLLQLRTLKEQVISAVEVNTSRIKEIDTEVEDLQQRHNIPQVATLLSTRTPILGVPSRSPEEFPERRYVDSSGKPVLETSMTVEHHCENNSAVVDADNMDDITEDDQHELRAGNPCENGVEITKDLTTQKGAHQTDDVVTEETGDQTISMACTRAPPKIRILDIAEELKSCALDVPSDVQLTDEEIEDIVVRVCRLLFTRENLVEENKSAQVMFDLAIAQLRREKLSLETDIKAAELRQITEYEGLVLLRTFEKKDQALTDKLENCKQQKCQVVKDIEQCKATLEEKISEIQVWKQLNDEIISEFDTIVGGETFQFYAPLLKVFKRRIKRSRKGNKGGDDDDDDSEEESESEDDYDDNSDEDSEAEAEEDTCPLGCDQALYDKVLELREKRLDQEDALNELRKAVDELKKSGDRFQGKEKQIDKDLTNTRLEIDAFQNEKQRELNKITVHIALTLDQLRCLSLGPEELPQDQSKKADLEINDADNEAKDESTEGNHAEVSNPDLTQPTTPENPEENLMFPSSIEDYIVFGKEALVKLHNRIGELVIENHEKKGEYRNLHLMQKKLGKERVDMESKIDSLEGRCNDLQMLKFGQLIDIDSLEKMDDSKTVVDLKGKILEQEAVQQQDLVACRRNIHEAEEQLLEMTRLNTAKLQEIASLTERQLRLENDLNSTAKSVQGREGSAFHQGGEERRELVSRVRFQAQEIDALKAEIIMLRRKDGTTGVQPIPPPTASNNQHSPNSEPFESSISIDASIS